MKVGSIVECVEEPAPFDCEWLDIPHGIKLGGIYTVNWLGSTECGQPRIGLEETHQRICYCLSFFREIEFPPAIEAEIKEALTKELEPCVTF